MKSKISITNIFTARGVLGLSVAFLYSPADIWWKQAIVVTAAGYLLITALMGKRD
ncbi:hypothetical protein H1S01_03430 [Heliobacterium chlorum]|uniref:Uncharacterized protein n=1 Tax=Heliobacterium chlorum TaxID=2698 RepID=A0ABR7T147_HELCL|nr:hypothetical protein [Heliobacterium chlorum]MBC9783564.1 hypothetical protein [Heliobacterium chlorum]